MSLFNNSNLDTLINRKIIKLLFKHIEQEFLILIFKNVKL